MNRENIKCELSQICGLDSFFATIEAFVDENTGQIFRSGGSKMHYSKHNPSTPGNTGYLVRILPKNNNNDNNSKKKNKYKK